MEKQELSLTDYLRSIWGILVFFAVLLILTPVCILLIIISAGRLANFVVERIGPVMGKSALYASGIEFNVINLNPTYGEPCIYIVNHSTTLDLLIFLALGLPGVRFVAKHELQYNPLFFLLGKMSGQIFIKRAQTDKAIKQLRSTYNRIVNDRLSLLMAPEGTRKHKGVIGPFKKGPFRIALDLSYPVVPVYIKGIRHLNGTSNFWVKKGVISTYIHPPISTEDWTLETLDRHIDTIRQKYVKWAEEDKPEDALKEKA